MSNDSNPVEPSQPLKRPINGEQIEPAHPPQPIYEEDSAITKAEKIERNGSVNEDNGSEAAFGEPAAKRVKIADEQTSEAAARDTRVKGVASIKKEYFT